MWVQPSVSKTRGIPAVNLTAAHYCQVRVENNRTGDGAVVLYARFDEVAIPLIEIEAVGGDFETATDAVYSYLEQMLKALATGERFLDLRKLVAK